MHARFCGQDLGGRVPGKYKPERYLKPSNYCILKWTRVVVDARLNFTRIFSHFYVGMEF